MYYVVGNLMSRRGVDIASFTERIGRDATGRWRDVVLLERRSRAVGAD